MEKRLYRNKKEKMIGGVCAGLGDYFSIDPVLARIVFVILTLHGGVGVLAYIIMWIVVPEDKSAATAAQAGADPVEAPHEPAWTPGAEAKPVKNGQRRSMIAGIILIVVGIIFLADNLLPWFCFGDFWPLILIAIGGVMIWNIFAKSQHKEDPL
jgi:phage shock protein C